MDMLNTFAETPDPKKLYKGFYIPPQMRQEISSLGQPMFGNRLASPIGDVKGMLKSKKGSAGPSGEFGELPDESLAGGPPKIFSDIEKFGTKDPYVYHLTPGKITPEKLDSFIEKGILPSEVGMSGPGVYMGNTPSATEYYATKESGTMFRIHKKSLIEHFGIYDKTKTGVQFDESTGELLLEGQTSIPPQYIEVKTPDGWQPLIEHDLTSTRAFKQEPPFKTFAEYAEGFQDKDIKPPLLGRHVTMTMERVAEFLDGGIQGQTYKTIVEPVYKSAEKMQLEGSKTKKDIEKFKIIEGSKDDRAASLIAQKKGTEGSADAKKLAKYIRAKYDDYLDRMNAIREKIGVEPIKKRKDYITHINEMNTLTEIFGSLDRVTIATRIKTLKKELMDQHPDWSDARALNSAKNQIEQTVGLAQFIDAKQPVFKFAKERLGEYEKDPSILRSFGQYSHQALRYIHQAENVARNKAYKDLLPPNAKEFTRKWNAEQVAGRTPPSPLHPGLKKFLMDLRGTFGANTILGNLGTTAMQLTSFPQVLAFTGLKNTGIGVGKRVWSYLPGKTSLFEHSRLKHLRNLDIDIGLGRSLVDSLLKKVGQFEKLKDPAAKTRLAIDFGREFLKGVMETADQFTVGASYEAFYSHGLQLGMEPGTALEYAEIMTGKTQANYFREALPPFLNTTAGKIIGQFGTYGMNQWRMIIDDAGKGMVPGMPSTRDPQSLMQWYIGALVSAYMVDTASEMSFGRQPYDVKALVDEGIELAQGESSIGEFGDQMIETGVSYVPFLSSVKYKSLPMVADFGKDVIFATIGQGKDRQKAQKDLLEKWSYSLMLPYAGNQVRKTVNGIKEMTKEDPKFEIEGNLDKMKGLMFGPYATFASREYYKIKEDRSFIKGKYKIEGPILSDDNIDKLKKMDEKEFKIYTNNYSERTIKQINKKLRRRR
jgi:hypothetical protein